MSTSGRVLAGVYGFVLAVTCLAFAALSGWPAEATGSATVRSALPGLGLASVAGIGAVGCLTVACDRRVPVGWWAVGLLPALARALWLLVS